MESPEALKKVASGWQRKCYQADKSWYQNEHPEGEVPYLPPNF